MSELKPIEQNGQRVLTTGQLAESFGTDSKTISKNFERNEGRYTIGKHYFSLEGESLKEFKASRQIDDNLKFAPVIYLWTEKGAWLQAKSLNTDEAWEAYEALVDDYYTVKQQSIDTSLLSPEMQMFKYMFDGVAKMQIEATETKHKLEAVETTVTAIQETLLRRDEDWRKSTNSLLNGAAYRMSIKHPDLRSESYRVLEERGHCDLNKRLRNLKDRLSEGGATKTKVENMTRMDVIEADPRLKEIYTMIVKEISIGSLKIAK